MIGIENIPLSRVIPSADRVGIEHLGVAHRRRDNDREWIAGQSGKVNKGLGRHSIGGVGRYF